MHPAFLYWWKYGRRQGECAAWAGSASAEAFRPWEVRHFSGSRHEGSMGGGFGVRRPLRYLAYKLELSDEQVTEMARILNALKTERAQAEVDERRTVSAFADAVEAETFGEARADEGVALRSDSAERVRHAVVRALREIHALLSAEQRKRLAYLIRTGALTL